ncbi:hypothetical protein, partial [Ramlibacter alkalitolerans]
MPYSPSANRRVGRHGRAKATDPSGTTASRSKRQRWKTKPCSRVIGVLGAQTMPCSASRVGRARLITRQSS